MRVQLDANLLLIINNYTSKTIRIQVVAMRFTKYAFVSAIEVANAIKFGSITSLELTELIIARIEKYNPSLNHSYFSEEAGTKES